jgi:hypothetical protein
MLLDKKTRYSVQIKVYEFCFNTKYKLTILTAPAFDAVISKWPPRATRDVEIEVTRIGKREETDWHTGGGRCGSPSIVYLSSGGGPPEFTEDATMVERKTNTRVTLRVVDTPWSKKLPPYDGKRDEENKKRNAAASALTEDSAGS